MLGQCETKMPSRPTNSTSIFQDFKVTTAARENVLSVAQLRSGYPLDAKEPYIPKA
jgi:hypothetical protein